MTTIAAGASATVTLAQGSRLKTTGTGIAVFGPGPHAGMQIGLQGANTLGPFAEDRTIYITATTPVNYSVAADLSTLSVARVSQDPSGNLTIVGSDGAAVPLSGGGTLNVTGTQAVGGVLTAAYAQGSGTIIFTRTPMAGGATADIGSAVASGSTYTVQTADRGYIIAARPVTYLPPNAAGLSIPTVAPLAPTITGITAGNGSVTVTFTRNADTGGDTVTGDRVNVYNAVTNALLAMANGTSPITVNGLTNGVSVYAKAATIGQVNGVGPLSAASSTATPSVSVAPALRPVTDRGALPNVISSSTTLNYVQARTAHIAHDRITAPVVEWTLASPQGSNEDPSNATATLISSSVEYPAGTFTQLTYGGSVTAAMNGTSILSSDASALAVAIPDGATFWVWIYMQNTSTNRTYYDDGMFGASTTSGEVGKYGASALTDYTMTGGLTNPGATTGTSFRPVCIRDISSKLTAYVMGDSRQRKTQGVYGHTNNKGRLGEAHRAVGARMAMINGAVSGDSYTYITGNLGATTPAAAYNVRKMLADRCDIIIDEYGINDLGTAATVTLTQFAGWINTMRALLGPTKPYYRQTVTPRSPSTDNFLTTANQTPQSNTPSRTAINDAIRNNTLALNNPMAGYFETADAVETARNSGYIKALSNRLVANISIPLNSTTVTAGTNQFSAADVGRMIYASATTFSALITGYVSPTQVTINLGPGTAVNSGDSVYVGMPTKDGLHYWPEAEVLMAADPSWNQLGTAAY